jgi:hypothetical protein
MRAFRVCGFFGNIGVLWSASARASAGPGPVVSVVLPLFCWAAGAAGLCFSSRFFSSFLKEMKRHFHEIMKLGLSCFERLKARKEKGYNTKWQNFLAPSAPPAKTSRN